MAQKKVEKQVSSGKRVAGIIGGIAFLVGFILTLVGGIAIRDSGGITLTLVILGILVAVLNITAKEVLPIMVAAIALIVVAGGADIFTPLNDIAKGLGTSLDSIVKYLATFMTPVAVISAIRAVIALTRPGD